MDYESAPSANLSDFPGGASIAPSAGTVEAAFMDFDTAPLLASADTPGGAVVGQDAAETPVATQGSGPQGEPGKETTHWARVRIPFSGYIGSKLLDNKSTATPGTMSTTEEVQLSGSTYIWQRWFAEAEGTVGFNSISSKTDQDSSKGLNVTGGGAISFFPVSRFPLQAFFSVADSRTNQELIGTSAYRSTTVGATQSYTPVHGQTRYGGGFTVNSLDGNSFGKDTQASFNGSMNTLFDDHVVAVNGNDVTDAHNAGSAHSNIFNLNARDLFHPADSTLTVESLGSINRSAFDITGTKATEDFIQATSVANWRPMEDSPLLLNGSAQVSRAESLSVTSQATNTSTALSAAGSLGASYQWSKNMRFSGSVSVSVNRGAYTVNGNSAGGISYNADPIRLGEYTYMWGLAGGLGTGISGSSQSQAGGGVQTRQDSKLTLKESANQSISRNFMLGDGAPSAIPSVLTMRLSESVTMTQAQAQTQTQTQTGSQNTDSLQHMASLSWSRNSEALQLFASVSGSDGRTQMGSIDLINAQLSVSGTLGRYSTVDGGLTAQASSQTSRSGLLATSTSDTVVTGAGNVINGPGLSCVNTGTNTTVVCNTGTPLDLAGTSQATKYGSLGANLSYSNSRAFGVPRLMFTSTFYADTTSTSSRFTGTVGAPVQPVKVSWENHFDYKIGALALELFGRVAKVGGKTNELIFLSVRRQFRGVL